MTECNNFQNPETAIRAVEANGNSVRTAVIVFEGGERPL